MTRGKKRKLKSLIGFHSANKVNNYNRGGEKEKEKEKNPKESTEQVKTKNNKCFSWVTALRVLSLAGSHSPPHLPRMPSYTLLISGPAVGAAQILIWSCSCVFLSPMFTAIRTSAFSFVGALSSVQFSSFQLLSHVQLFVTPWITAFSDLLYIP